jgi:hypothetical protein
MRILKSPKKLLGCGRVPSQTLHPRNKRFLLGDMPGAFGDVLIGVGKPALQARSIHAAKHSRGCGTVHANVKSLNFQTDAADAAAHVDAAKERVARLERAEDV